MLERRPEKDGKKGSGAQFNQDVPQGGYHAAALSGQEGLPYGGVSHAAQAFNGAVQESQLLPGGIGGEV